MSPRRQLPVHSPLTWGALAAGAAAAVRGDRAGHLRGRLARTLRASYDAVDIVLTDSGTSALRLAIAGATEGDARRRVALPGYTCYDMASAAEGAGAHVILYDVDPGTLGPDPASLRAAVSAGATAVVVGHLFGHLVDLDAVRDAIGDALLVEDAAQGVGGILHGRPLGSFGSVSVLSFGRGKGMTGGGGGALLAHDERGAAILGRARAYVFADVASRGGSSLAALAAQRMLGRPALYAIPSSLPFLHLGETVYHPPRALRAMSVASLAVLERVMELAEDERGARTRNAGRLLAALARSGPLRPPDPVPEGEPGYLRLPVVLKGGDAGALPLVEGGRLGVARGYPTTLAALPSLAVHLVGARPSLPGSEELARGLVTLPTHALLTESDLVAIEGWLAGLR